MSPLTLQRRQLFYSGNVQGVGFRYTAQRIARGYEVTGFVRNTPDGRVELVAEGPPDQLDGFLDELRERMADRIRSVESDLSGRQMAAGKWRPANGEFADFAIRY